MINFNLIYAMSLPWREVSDYKHINDRANKDGKFWPAIPTIARELKFSESTVRRAIKDLIKAGIITTEQRYRDSGGKSSLLYTMN